MLEHKIGGLPVVQDGNLVGIITESDIFKLVIVGSSDTKDRTQDPDRLES